MSSKKNESAFECQMCGHCCHGEGGIVVTDEEQARIADLLSLSVEVFRKEFVVFKNEKGFLATRADGYCKFFTDKGCKVHSVKPDVCRAWPFFKGNLVDSESWTMAQDYCPGINLKAGHREFVLQGAKYLKKHMQCKKGRLANALSVDLDELVANTIKTTNQ